MTANTQTDLTAEHPFERCYLGAVAKRLRDDAGRPLATYAQLYKWARADALAPVLQRGPRNWFCFVDDLPALRDKLITVLARRRPAA